MRKLLSPLIAELLFILRVLLHSANCKQICGTESSKKAIIIGNGPSLLKTLENNLSDLQANDCFMVNNAVEQDCFGQIKPKYCVFADPNFFLRDTLHKCSKPVVDVFNNKLDWNLTVFIPFSAKGSLFETELRNNKNISLVYFSSVSSDYIFEFNKRRLFRYWNKNIACPLSQTVLNTATSLAITLKYKEIYLVGADTSWIEMLDVDQSNNDIYSTDKHFYKNDKRLLYRFNESRSCLAEELKSIARALESYQIIKEYAVYNNCNLYNASEYSLIDTLDRKHL